MDVIECIKAFEAGAQNVYFVDGDGRYSGIAMPKKRFSYGWSRQAAMTVPCPEIQDKSLGGGGYTFFLASRSGSNIRRLFRMR